MDGHFAAAIINVRAFMARLVLQPAAGELSRPWERIRPRIYTTRNPAPRSSRNVPRHVDFALFIVRLFYSNLFFHLAIDSVGHFHESQYFTLIVVLPGLVSQSFTTGNFSVLVSHVLQ